MPNTSTLLEKLIDVLGEIREELIKIEEAIRDVARG